MGKGRTQHILTQHVAGGEPTARPDELIVEEPLEIQVDGTIVATTMRTPGHDFELAVGFCHTDGVLGSASVHSVRYCTSERAADVEFNIVVVDTDGTAPSPKPRLGIMSSSCGLCGSVALEELRERLTPLDNPQRFDPASLLAVVAKVRAEQDLFSRTGAVHAAAAFDATGALVYVREDIGRHNAVDKVVGRLRLDGALPARGLGLFVSGRASFEMVTKAWAAGFDAVVAVSAPSALAVEAARVADLQLAGFVRDETLNLYSPV